ncbi:hypothetical protein EZS27_003807 [termite gut metagenome]|jgi:hypothetical protein|uniref:Uncharacterized protein n=1 Tax=termite gut metagenome TaxID=433724 RepID=A0A5J4SSD5_9ZZZZ
MLYEWILLIIKNKKEMLHAGEIFLILLPPNLQIGME